MGGFLRRIALATLVAVASQVPVAASTDGPVDEYQVKAAFLFNFAKFVMWSDQADGPLIIGVVGEDPFGEVLDAAVRGKAVAGRPLIVRRFGSGTDVQGCHILFVSASERRRFGDLVRRVGAGVLTVGEVPQFTREGGVIGFFVEGNRVRFHINPRAAASSGLKIHSQLMSLSAK